MVAMTLARGVLLVAACVSLLSVGCYVLPMGNPRPNIALIQQMKTLKLALGSTVPDSFPLPGSDFSVQGWHGTLKNGFKNGFMGAYGLILGEGPADKVLTIDMAELGLAACVETMAVGCIMIRYQATLSDTAGTIRRTAGSAESRYRITDGSDQPRDMAKANVDSAVETMYEKIAKELSSEPVTPSVK